MIKVYRVDHDYTRFHERAYVVVSESGVWENYMMSEMKQEEVIEWFHSKRRIPRKSAWVRPRKYPHWLRYFLGKYSWMFNDPLSWRRDGFNEKEIRIPYKWL